MKVNLLDALKDKSEEQAKSFLDNRQDDGQFSEFKTAESIEVEDSEIPGWVYEFGRWLEDSVEVSELIETKPPVDRIKRLNDIDPKKLKRALIYHFGESEHGGWEGFNNAESDAIYKYIDDLLLTIDQIGDDDKPFSMGDVIVE